MEVCSRCSLPFGPGRGRKPGRSTCNTCNKKRRDPASSPRPDRFGSLLAAVRGGPLSFEDFCNKLDLSPARARELLAEAAAAGVQIHQENGHVGMELVEEPSYKKATSIIKPTNGEFVCAVISDPHFGSKYCLRAQLNDFVHWAYKQGVRVILMPGDMLDGDYRHGKFEMSHMGLEDQARDMSETLPSLDGLSYHAISGNHDFTFTESSGVSVGRVIQQVFTDGGRNDFRFHGERGAFLRLGKAVVHLWHPRSGGAYASSYPLQKRVEGYAGGEKPHVLLAGHWHRYCHIYERSVHALACPTFQGGGSAFSRSLGGSPAIGGLLLRWEMTGDGTMRNFAHTYRAYFEQEIPREIGG